MNQSELITLASANALNKDFEVKYQNVISDFFSGIPQMADFNHPQIQAITQFRQTTDADVQQINRYPQGKDLLHNWPVSHMSVRT